MTSATSLLPVLEVPEEDAHNTGISTANSGLIADTDSDFLIGCDGASEYAAFLRRRHMNKTPSLGRPETLGDGAAEMGSRRRSLNAVKEHLLAYDFSRFLPKHTSIAGHQLLITHIHSFVDICTRVPVLTLTGTITITYRH